MLRSIRRPLFILRTPMPSLFSPGNTANRLSASMNDIWAVEAASSCRCLSRASFRRDPRKSAETRERDATSQRDDTRHEAETHCTLGGQSRDYRRNSLLASQEG